MPYSEHEIERIGRIGFETAMKRRKKLTCVDKANVLDTSRLWRAVMHRLQAEYPEVEYSEMFVDNCAMQICKNPAQFDVIVTENMFGDILSDEASEITGSIGMVPSSSPGRGHLRHCMSRSTALRPTLPGRTWSTPSPAFCPPL